jgi:XTP/dITP diphosphohydrolase
MKIILATSNLNKVEEMRAWAYENNLKCEFLLPEKKIEVVEDGETIWENARKKVEAYRKVFTYPILADDTGLFVEALQGRPGVNSARYSDAGTYDDNRKKLLEELRDEENRKAYFMTVIAFNYQSNLYFFSGKCKGEIALQEHLAENDFGYDPIFKPEGMEQTFSEMNMQEKNAISHRGRALKNLEQFLRNIING